VNLRIALNGVLAAMLFLCGCGSAGQRLERRAEAAGLERIRAETGLFPSLLYIKRAPDQAAASAPLLVFIEGDGMPWRNGREPSIDPTTREPLALEMMFRSRAPAAYVTRPCYHRLHSDKCNAEQWTGARYSDEIVTSMVDTVREAQRLAGARQVSLVGYSGGGVLAVLIAERLEHVASVVTIAANLDTDAWAAHHRYLPLSQSLNPSRSNHEHPWPEWHLQGSNDVTVPAATTAAYFIRYPRARSQLIGGYDHVCCWLRDWQQLSRSVSLAVE
jgi:pimeloyl-ACP methyl ester carboxylesterase